MNEYPYRISVYDNMGNRSTSEIDLDECVLWWQNFVNSLFDASPGMHSVWNDIGRELAKSNGYKTLDDPYVCFKTEQDAMWFVLKWS